MLAFILDRLDAVNRLGEILFALIMALGFTGACRLGLDKPDNRELFGGILGCNLAWAIVDGAMYAMTALFERGRRARLLRMVLKAPTQDDALRRIDKELGDRFKSLTTEVERRQIYGWVMAMARRGTHEPARLYREDVEGGAAVALVILLATMPVVIPFLIFRDPQVAVRASNLVAIALLFCVGCWWGQEIGANRLRVGVGLMLVGVLLVLIAVVLGG